VLDRHEVLAEEEFFPLAAREPSGTSWLGPDGTISLGALLAAFREAGHEVGPRRREDLEHILRQLYVSGYLDSADESGEAPAAPVGEHEAAIKMWWSR
jgi:hypothetical protein